MRSLSQYREDHILTAKLIRKVSYIYILFSSREKIEVDTDWILISADIVQELGALLRIFIAMIKLATLLIYKARLFMDAFSFLQFLLTNSLSPRAFFFSVCFLFGILLFFLYVKFTYYIH